MISQIFPNFEPELQSALQAKCITRSYKKGKRFLLKGQSLPGAYVISKGLVSIYRANDKGNEFILSYLKTGDSFGMSVCDDSPALHKKAVVSFAAAEDVEILILSFAEKDALAGKYEQWYKYILSSSIAYYSFYLELFDCIVFQKTDARIGFFLNRLAKTRNTNELKVSHQEIAEGLNTSREVVSRLLKKMQAMGKIELAHNHIKIC